MDNTLPCEFVVHLGDGASDNTAFVNGVGLPKTAGSLQEQLQGVPGVHLNLPFHYVGGNIDLTDYSDGPDLPEHDNDPFVLLRTYVDETELNHYPYAMMRNGILFLALPEMDYEPWTRPALYEWVEFMTTYYHHATTIIFSHQAIEDTTPHDGDPMSSYRGQQDQAWWATSVSEQSSDQDVDPRTQSHARVVRGQPAAAAGAAPSRTSGTRWPSRRPHPQMEWATISKEDTVAIYTISSTGVTSRAWENNGAGGHWVSGFDTTWKVPTTYDPNAEDWYSFPALIQDGETQRTDMKVLSSEHHASTRRYQAPSNSSTIPTCETKGSHVNENILGFDDDPTSKVTANTPGMTVHGATKLTFPPKHEWDKYCHDGHGGQPYHYFSVGTSPAAAPGGSYTITMTAKSASGRGKVNLAASTTDWGTKSQLSTLPGSSRLVFSHDFGQNYETVSGTYTAPNDPNAWLIQGILEFVDSTDYDVSYFSIKRTSTSDSTEDFRMMLSGKPYGAAGRLGRFQTKDFPVNPVDLADRDGVITSPHRSKATIMAWPA